jgi:hypothetical protein
VVSAATTEAMTAAAMIEKRILMIVYLRVKVVGGFWFVLVLKSSERDS